jgi:radical SAM superfamily enzyme YgiQ (UPF0313 family)
MQGSTVILICIEEYDNLGTGYLASMLAIEGFNTEIIDFRKGKKDILKSLLRVNPLIVGFSVVYENYISDFADLLSCLREGGITCHFTAGGHYASLRYKEIFGFMPTLNSVVRFEGEYTFTELVTAVSEGKEWRGIKGIAYNRNGKIVTNEMRPPETDLDRFPFPVRSLPLKTYTIDRKFATLIAGRGCKYNCSYCSTREFQRQSGGPFKRVRKPEMVISEMASLYRNHGCSIFLFQDDDFPIEKNKDEWIEHFCSGMEEMGLKGRIMWKINCRPDEVNEKLFEKLKGFGLFLVFLGIEDGTDIGLRRFNKHISLTDTLNGISVLKRLDIGFDYGFMLFQPETTFKSLNENLDFLREMCSDGFTPVTFLKVLPYYATRIERELKAEGRLKGKPGFLDYDFKDNRLNNYYKFISHNFVEWLRAPNGMANISKWIRNYISVLRFFNPWNKAAYQLSETAKGIVAESNIFILDTLKDLSQYFDSEVKHKEEGQEFLDRTSEKIMLKHKSFTDQINGCLNRLYYFYNMFPEMQNYV